MRRFLALLAALVMALAMLPGAGLAHGADTEITIIHDTHVHGNFAGGAGNIAQKAAIINQIRTAKPSALFVGNGDDLATSILSGEFKGSHVVDAFNQMGLVANTFGNHDFDLGPENLIERIKESKFTWVSANVRDKATGDVFGAAAGAKRFHIVDVGGVKVGFTGIAPYDTPSVSSPGPNVEFLGYVPALKEVVPQMRAAGAQVVIVLSHACANDSEAVAAQVDGITAIVGDHCAGLQQQPKVINGTIVSRVTDEYNYVGELTLTVHEGQVTGHKFTLHTINKETQADPAIKAVMDAYQSKLDAKLMDVIGATATPLDSMKAHNRFRETGLGNYVSDVTRAIVNADVAITNGGNIRAEKIYQPGLLTKKDIVDSLPFPNVIMKLEITGDTIVKALEHGVSEIENGNGRFPQVSGITFKIDPTQPKGKRVSDVMVNGKPVALDRTYTLGVNSFLAGGGDGYEMLKTARVLIDAGSAPLVNTAVIEAIQKAGMIAPRPEGRILYVSGVTMEVGKAELKIAGRAQRIDVAPEIKDGKFYVPLRHVTELYGANVVWQPQGSRAIVVMPWGDSLVVESRLDGYTTNGRFMVPTETLKKLGIKSEIKGNIIEFKL